jgi:hypothetical protein
MFFLSIFASCWRPDCGGDFHNPAVFWPTFFVLFRRDENYIVNAARNPERNSVKRQSISAALLRTRTRVHAAACHIVLNQQMTLMLWPIARLIVF